MKIKHILLGTILAAVAGLAVSASWSWTTHQGSEQAALDASFCETNLPRSAAVWKEVYSTPEQLVEGVDMIVMAEASNITPSRIAKSDGDNDDELPFELVAFRVLNTLKGKAAAQDLIYVERAGGSDSKGRPIAIDFDGGSFDVGRSYLLFLKQQEEGPYFYQVNDQGRYEAVGNELKATGTLEDDVVKQFFANQSVDEALRSVNQKLGRAGK